MPLQRGAELDRRIQVRHAGAYAAVTEHRRGGIGAEIEFQIALIEQAAVYPVAVGLQDIATVDEVGHRQRIAVYVAEPR